MRKLLLTVALLLLAVALAACGSEDEAASGASELAPAGALIYGEVTLDPEGDQEQAIDSIVSKFPGGGAAGDKLKKLFDDALEKEGSDITFEEDIEPWLGDEAGVFVSRVSATGEPSSAVLMIATDDEDASRDVLRESAEGEVTTKTYKDVEYFMDEAEDVNTAAVFNGFLVAGDEKGVKASIDAGKGGETLADDEQYTQAVEDASEDRLGLFYLNSPRLLESLPQGGSLPESFDKYFEEPVVATIDADDDGVVFEAEVAEELAQTFGLGGEASDLLTELPADSWVAMAQTDFGKLLDFYIDSVADLVGGRDTIERQLRAATGLDLERDVLAWMGDFAIFVRGTTVAELDGALIIETTDEQASGRLLDALRGLVTTQAQGAVRVGPLSAPGGGEGFTVSSGSIPKPVHVFQRGGRVVFAYGDTAASDAVDAGSKLGDDPDFASTRDALGEYDVSFYILLQPIFDLVDSTGAADSADWQDAQAYLEPLRAFVAGTSREGESLKSAFKLVVE